MPARYWRLLESREISDHKIFRLIADRYRLEPEGRERDFFKFSASDWINVIPLTDQQEVVMVRQFRHGVQEVTLEIPGGMIDGDESPAVAAGRELREETGYRSQKIRSLGKVWPNPAIQTNQCHFFLAEDVRYEGSPQPDPYERIEVVTVPLAEIPRMLADGQIRHALVVTAFAMLGVVANGESPGG